MPVPPPPPPPPGPPPPPSFNLSSPSGGAQDAKSRNQLLDSIRQGKKLKKAAIVNDRSAPLVDGKLITNNKNLNKVFERKKAQIRMTWKKMNKYNQPHPPIVSSE